MKPKEIRELRVAMGLTPTEFGVRVGVSDNTVRQWEIGTRRPSGSAQIILNLLADSLAAKK